MSTFTLQDLNLPMTADEAIKAVEMGKALANHELAHQQAQQNMLNNALPQPITKEEFMEYGMNNPLSTNATNEGLLNNITQILNAPEPQPTLADVINNICTQLQLLTTLISSSAPKPTEPEAGENSLQETVSLTLQQADWFKDMVRRELIGGGIEDLAKDAVQEVVESEVESYFDNRFDPTYHFDFDDAVHDAVGDRIDDVVSDKIDDAVDSYLSNATISITK